MPYGLIPDRERFMNKTRESAMQPAEWVNDAVKLVIGMLVGLVIFGAVQFMTTSF